MSLLEEKKCGRSVTSCSECQRRKQKCDRNWPCNHCQARNTAHLCQFRKLALKPSSVGLLGGGSSASGSGPGNQEDGTITSSKKRRHMETPSSSGQNPGSLVQDFAEPDVGNVTRALQDLGYVDSDVFRVIDSASTGDTARSSPLPIRLPEEIQKALRAIPARPYTDDLVQNFFEHVNYHYNILHQTSFLSVYTGWWARKRELQAPGSETVVFTCLVLRILANSIQFLPLPLLAKLESDLGESASGLSTHYHTSAQTLSNYLLPGAGGLMQVQQLFLGATWLKAEAEFVRAWHAVGEAVRVGQEIGMHKDDPSPAITDFEREMRKRVWVGLYTWDRFMSALFNRPSLIPSTTPIPLPNPRLDQPSLHPDIPSPFVAKMLEFELASQLSLLMANTTTTPNTQSDLLQYVETWLFSLPPVFSITNPNTTWDVQIPRLVFQRLQLHCSGYMTLLMLLQPYLNLNSTSPSSSSTSTSTASPKVASSNTSDNANPLHNKAIDTALHLMTASLKFFHISHPDKVKYFMVAFSPFNTGALLCAVLMGDQDRVVYRRREVIEAVGTALWTARKLRGRTRLGDATAGVLERLVGGLVERGGVELGERVVLEGARGRASGDVGFGEVFGNGNASYDLQMASGNGEGNGNGNGNANANANVNGGTWEEQEGFGLTPDVELDPNLGLNLNLDMNLDLGVLDGVWDWESTLFDPFRNP